MGNLFTLDPKGTHEDGCGWDPAGNFCGECGDGTCEGCPVWAKRCSENKQK